jgi:hypothetical protein
VHHLRRARGRLYRVIAERLQIDAAVSVSSRTDIRERASDNSPDE